MAKFSFDLLISGLHNSLRNNGLDAPPFNETMIWRRGDSTVNDTVLWFAETVCGEEFCRLQGFEGNSDIAGIGVLINQYSRETVLF